jgi:hypothetical protein
MKAFSNEIKSQNFPVEDCRSFALLVTVTKFISINIFNIKFIPNTTISAFIFLMLTEQSVTCHFQQMNPVYCTGKGE